MTRFHTDTAAVAVLGVGLLELAASTSGRSVVDPPGRVVVDAMPLPVVEQAVRLTGTTDKPLLRASLLAGAGVVAGLAAALLRDDASVVPTPRAAFAAATGLAAYAAGRRRLDARRVTQDEHRRPVAVGDPLPPRTDGAEAWDHAEPLFTDVGGFYATDVNLRPPLVDRDTWRLQLSTASSGAPRTAELSLDDIRDMELRERDALLICVHNRLGWDRLGHQRWTGLPVAAVFAAAGVPLPDDIEAHDLVMEAVDGYRQVMSLREVLARESWVVVGMAGRELPAAHGFPARVMTPGVVGQYNGTKWLQRLAVVPRGTVTATWVARGWPLQTIVPPPMARIDHPGEVQMPPRLPQGELDVAGDTTFVGTAWAPANGGIAGVELRVDGGPWRPAELADDLGPWSWRRWRATPSLEPGSHRVAVRCTAHDGTVQSGEPREPFPYGATGHHTLRVRVPR